jgi:hypothetical protein
MPLRYAQTLLNDFSAGITDKIVNAPPNSAAALDNFFINEYGKPELRWGTTVKFEQDAVQRIMGLFLLNDDLFAFRNEEMYIYDSVGPSLTALTTPNPEPFFQSTGTEIYPNAAEWRDQLYVCNTDNNRPMRIYRDNTNTLRAHEIGVPAFDGTSVNFTPPGVGSTFTYIYEIHWSYTYNVGGVTYKNVGQTYRETVESSVAIGPGNPVSITGLPTLSVTNNQLDVSNFKIEIYRTQNNGTVPFLISTLNHGTATDSDTAADSTLLNNASIYNADGSFEHTRAPKCKAMVVVNDIAYYLAPSDEDTGEVKPYRVQQSMPGIPSATDADFFEEFDDKVVGGSHINGIPLIMTETYIYRIDGAINVFGNGVMRKRVLSETAGCVSHNSIIRVNDRVYWMGRNGVYVTDGFKVDYIPAVLNLQDTYAELSSTEDRRKKVTATYDYREERIFWACSDNDVENNQLFVLNLKTGGFNKVKGNQFFPTALEYLDQEVVRGDELGYIYSHTEDVQSDLNRDVLNPVSDWVKTHIPYYFESALVDFGNPAMRKWVPEATMSFGVVSNMAVKPISNNDKSRVVAPMKEMRSVDSFFWNDPNFIWNDPNTSWRAAEVKTFQRHFPRGSARCRRKQVIMEPAQIIRYISDSLGNATVGEVNPGISTDLFVDLDTAGVIWPSDIVEQFIAFESEGYANLHSIKSRTDTQLIITGGGSPTLAADQKWQIVGFEKDQKFTIESISIRYANIDNQGDKFSTEQDGGNA